MMMPIKKNKISFTLDLTDRLKKVKPSKRKETAELIGITLIDSMGEFLDRSTSPVSKGLFKKTLSKAYKKLTGKTKADLQLSGDMLGDLQVDAFKDRVTIKITDREEKLKSFNHNTGDTLPVRKFLPDDANNEKFKPAIMKRVAEIIDDASEN